MKHNNAPPPPKTPRPPLDGKGLPVGLRRSMTLAVAIPVVLVLALSLAVAALVFRPGATPTPTPGATGTPTGTPIPTTPTPVPPTPTPEGYGQVRILDIGDNLLHDAVILSGKQADGTYDFSRFYRTLKATISAADLSIADLEGTLGGEPYSGYPAFCAPDAIATALFQAGFDISVTANNHMNDRGMKGLLRTVDVLRSAGLTVVGTRKTLDEPRFTVVERNGIRIGVSAFTFETPSSDGRVRINALPLAKEAEELIDTFNPYASDFADDIAALQQRERDMRAAGAELTVFVLHWGDEYKTHSNAYQRRIAQALADVGVDVIFGQHPHCIEEISVLASSDGTHEMPVFYSTGNFVSNMVYDTHDTNGITEDGLLVSITAVRQPDGSVRVVSADYLPIYCYKVNEDGLRRYEVIPATDARATGSIARIRKILAGSTGTATLPVTERTAG